MQVGHGSESGCRNPVTATAARTAELQPAGDPVPAGSEVKPAWPSDSAPTGPPLLCPITAGSAPARSSPHRAGKQAPPHPRGPPGRWRVQAATGTGEGSPAACARSAHPSLFTLVTWPAGSCVQALPPPQTYPPLSAPPCPPGAATTQSGI